LHLETTLVREHARAGGDANELAWARTLNALLPRRACAELRLGAEVNVRGCRDGELLGIHDASVGRHRRAPKLGGATNREGAPPKVPQVRQPKTTVENPARGCSRDRNEEQDSGTAALLGGTKQRRRRFCSLSLGRDQGIKTLVVALARRSKLALISRSVPAFIEYLRTDGQWRQNHVWEELDTTNNPFPNPMPDETFELMETIPNDALRLDDLPSPDADGMEVWRLADTFNGFKHWGSFERCAEIADRHFYDQQRDSNLTELRTCLFFECRRWHHYGKQPDKHDSPSIRGLVEKIREMVTTGRAE
jgi:hypothetical protein